MSQPLWTLSATERATLDAALDALLPPEGAYPAPSATGIVDDFILVRVPPADSGWTPYPWIDADGLRRLLAQLAGRADMTAALEELEALHPSDFLALWRLAVYGYYSRPETITAIQVEHNVAYHGAPLPIGYLDVLPAWNADDPLQLAPHPVGSFIATDEVRNWDINDLREELERP